MADYLNLDLRPASFRGVPFHVDGAGIEVGRRVQVHEYPQRDKPWAEDLGRATRGFTLEAFVVGPAYIEDAKALIAAAEEEGPGTLVHPWLGSMEVSLKELMRVRFDASAGHAVISFGFVEPGDLEFPSAEDSTPAQSQMAADSLCTAASESFSDVFGVEGFPSFVGDAAGDAIRTAFGYAGQLGGGLSVLSGWASQLNGYATAAVRLLGTPLALAQQVMDVFDLSGLVASLSTGSAATGPTYATATALTPTADPMAAMAMAIVALAGNGGAGGVLNAPMSVATATPARQRLVGNTAAVNALVRRALLAQAVGISSHVDATVQTDARSVRDALCTALDLESLVADDTSYNALQVARRAVWTDLTARSTNGARLQAFTPRESLPALLLAHDLYEDAGRADEMVTRNNIIHPGFVPMQTLQVLSQ
jgi:prophage DNA circulation protein